MIIWRRRQSAHQALPQRCNLAPMIARGAAWNATGGRQTCRAADTMFVAAPSMW
jgi:hypothetical protein